MIWLKLCKDLVQLQLDIHHVEQQKCEHCPQKDHFRFIDNLSILQLIWLSWLVRDHNFHQHLASDISVGQSFLPPNTVNTKEHLNFIIHWTDLEKVVNRPQAENSELYKVLKIVWFTTKNEQKYVYQMLVWHDKILKSWVPSLDP